MERCRSRFKEASIRVLKDSIGDGFSVTSSGCFDAYLEANYGMKCGLSGGSLLYIPDYI